jgi:hypothetical protein
MLRTAPLRRYVLATAIVSASVLWVSAADCRAQEAHAAALTGASHLTVGAEEAGAQNTPHLVLGMLEPGDAPSYGPARLPGNEAANPSTPIAVAQPSGAVAAANRTTNSPAQTSQSLPVKQTPTGLGSIKGYSFLNDRWTPEALMQTYQANHFARESSVTGNQAPTHEAGSASVPLVHLHVSSVSLPVVLAGTTVSR